MIDVDDVLRTFAEFIFVLDDGFQIHSHAGAFARWFNEEWEFQFGAERLIANIEFLKRGNGQAAIPPDAFCKGFIKGDSIR